jgi:hypothetical protein
LTPPAPEITLEDLRALRLEARQLWLIETAHALNRIARMATALRETLGEISHDEAIDGLKQEAMAAIEEIR